MDNQERFCFVFINVILAICLVISLFAPSYVDKHPQVGKVIDTQNVYVDIYSTKGGIKFYDGVYVGQWSGWHFAKVEIEGETFYIRLEEEE